MPEKLLPGKRPRPQLPLDPDGTELQHWWSSPLGTLLREQEQRVVADALEDVFGLQLLQIGAWGPSGALFCAARTQRQTVLSITPSSPGDVRARPAELPIASDSVDAVLLPHTLEFEQDPYTVLREVDRVLAAEGKLLILGFCPYSAWGLRHHFSAQGFPPGLARLLSEGRLKDWLALLGFEVTQTERYMRQLPRPLPASAFLIKAHKRVYTMTPVRSRRWEKRALVGGLVEPSTTRVAHQRIVGE